MQSLKAIKRFSFLNMAFEVKHRLAETRTVQQAGITSLSSAPLTNVFYGAIIQEQITYWWHFSFVCRYVCSTGRVFIHTTNNSTVYEFSGWFCCGAFRSLQHHGERSSASTVAVESECVVPTVCLRDLQSMISPQHTSYRLETKQQERWAFIAPQHISENSSKRCVQALWYCSSVGATHALQHTFSFLSTLAGWSNSYGLVWAQVKRQIDGMRSEYCFKHISRYRNRGGGG